MKAFALSALFVFSGFVMPASADTAEVLQAKAEKAYASREFSTDGITHAQTAADLYGQLATLKSEPKEKAIFLVKQSEALYFTGNATADVASKAEIHWKAYELADTAAKALGVSNVSEAASRVDAIKGELTTEQLALLGEALYFRGINLGQWGQANGVTSSLSRWGELKDTMLLIIDLGLAEIHQYGANRTLGRGYFKIPALLGGSMKKAEQYLKEAYVNTLDVSQKFSANGYNTLYYAELLYEIGDEDDAVAMLEAFVAADASVLNPDSLPETRAAQRDAQKLLKDWQ